VVVKIRLWSQTAKPKLAYTSQGSICGLPAALARGSRGSVYKRPTLRVVLVASVGLGVKPTKTPPYRGLYRLTDGETEKKTAASL
jgi:hypothetical protein